jgi:hypothetical protein
MAQGKVPVLGSMAEEVKPVVSGGPLLVVAKSAWMKISSGAWAEAVVKNRGFQVTGGVRLLCPVLVGGWVSQLTFDGLSYLQAGTALRGAKRGVCVVVAHVDYFKKGVGCSWQCT